MKWQRRPSTARMLASVVSTREPYDWGAAGAETLHAPGISTFPHTTGEWNPLHTPAGALRAARAASLFASSARATEALVRRVGADLVHLNSLVLAPSAAGVDMLSVELCA